MLLSEQIDGQPGTEGLPALRREFEAHGTDVDKLCMRYVLDGEAGSNSSELNHAWFPTGYRVGKLDYDAVTGAVRADRLLADRGLRLADFASHPVAMKARLSLAETAALRLVHNAGLRVDQRAAARPCPSRAWRAAPTARDSHAHLQGRVQAACCEQH